MQYFSKKSFLLNWLLTVRDRVRTHARFIRKNIVLAKRIVDYPSKTVMHHRNLFTLVCSKRHLRLGKMLRKTRLECPRCHWIFVVQQPDSAHFAWSFQKPLQDNIEGDLIKRDFVCRNPRCNEPITVYWYTPKQYMTLI